MGTLTKMFERQLREVAALAEHALDVVGDDLCAHGPGRDLADLP